MLSNDFVERGYSIQFLACIPENHFFKLDSRIEFSEPKPNKGKFRRYFNLLYFLRKEVKEFNPDIVMVFGDYFNSIVLMALIGTGHKVYIADQMSPTKKFPLIIGLLKKILYPFATGIIAQTELSADYHKKRYGKKINVRVIANPISMIPQIYPPKEKYIVVVARMHYDKGIDIALETWSKVKNKGDWKMVFAGGGGLLEQMKNYAEELGITSEVLFFGEIKDVFILLAKSEIFVLSSRGEGFPNALCEAMGSGLPSICFENLNNPMIITENDRDGVLIPNNDKLEMARQLEVLMQDDYKRRAIGINARAIVKRLDIKVIAPEFLQFILSKS
jgi:glycosyltransferase involved in cell wall biosynthesis